MTVEFFTLRMMKQRIHILFICLLTAFGSAATAHAESATFTQSGLSSEDEAAALSTAGDNAGALVGLNETLGILFENPFATTRSDDNVAIFTLAPATGDARILVRIGVFNDGSPTFVLERNVTAGNTFSVSNLFNRGCSAFGGCDYIEIVTTRARGGAAGAEVDYVDVNGEVTTVTSPAPEPEVWSLMIIGFAGLAWRAKRRRRALTRQSWRSCSPSSA